MADRLLLSKKKLELEAEHAKLHSIEEKWISNQILQDTYERWHDTISRNTATLEADIEILSGDQQDMYNIVRTNLHKLQDLRFIYEHASTLEKQDLLKLEF
ncbi:MAG: hypothetical protein ACTHLE_14100 [Agriterribacter sp.]